MNKFEEIISSHINGQRTQWKKQVKKLTRAHRAELVDYIRDTGREAMAFDIAHTIISGGL